jgi:AhpD family alkylhydroperoxidase
MDEKTRLLVSIGAAMAANCAPCFDHYYRKATAAGVPASEIAEALEAAAGVKKGAHLALKNHLNDVMATGAKAPLPCDQTRGSGCCG